MSPFQWFLGRPIVLFQLAVASLAAVLLPVMLRRIPSDAHTLALGLIAAVLLFDLTVTSVGLTWWMRRKQTLTAQAVVGILLSGLFIASFTLPTMPARLMALSLLDPLLLGVAIWALINIRRGIGQANMVLDPVEAIQVQLTKVVPRPVAYLLSHEVLLWWSLKGGPALIPAGAQVITSHLKAGRSTYIWLYIVMELPLNLALHASLHQQGAGTLAWLLTIADTSVVLYLLALMRSYERFPTFVQDGTLYLRQGLLWQAEIPMHTIETSIHGAEKSAQNLNLMVAPNVTLHLSQAVTVRGLWGRRRTTDRLAFFVDDFKTLHNSIHLV